MSMPIYKDGGQYLGRIVNWGLCESDKKKTPQFFVTFSVLGERKADGTEECPQYERTVFRAITENTIEYITRDLRNLGYEDESFDRLDPAHPQAHSFKGKEIPIRCKHDDYEGDTTEKWEFDFAGSFKPKSLEKTGVARLNALFGNMLKKPKANGTPATASQEAAAADARSTEKQAEEVF